MDRDTALERLPAPYAEALRLHDRGADQAEIARALGIDEASVEPLLLLGETKLTQLRRQIREPGNR